MNKSEIPFLTATEISEQIRNRDVSPVEVAGRRIWSALRR